MIVFTQPLASVRSCSFGVVARNKGIRLETSFKHARERKLVHLEQRPNGFTALTWHCPLRLRDGGEIRKIAGLRHARRAAYSGPQYKIRIRSEFFATTMSQSRRFCYASRSNSGATRG
jgi:hypothetical protein